MILSEGTVAHLNYVIKISTQGVAGGLTGTRGRLTADSDLTSKPGSQCRCKNPARQELKISLYFKAKIFIRPISWQPWQPVVDAGLVQIILEVKNNSVTVCHNCH